MFIRLCYPFTYHFNFQTVRYGLSATNEHYKIERKRKGEIDRKRFFLPQPSPLCYWLNQQGDNRSRPFQAIYLVWGSSWNYVSILGNENIMASLQYHLRSVDCEQRRIAGPTSKTQYCVCRCRGFGKWNMLSSCWSVKFKKILTYLLLQKFFLNKFSLRFGKRVLFCFLIFYL